MEYFNIVIIIWSFRESQGTTIKAHRNIHTEGPIRGDDVGVLRCLRIRTDSGPFSSAVIIKAGRGAVKNNDEIIEKCSAITVQRSGEAADFGILITQKSNFLITGRIDH
ncbi:hypothetical protein GWI33_019428 [Rhynchophorus ferrugineus]|uniref:Uncharacterized protein n=1 Tax=Rhynchophorus ferrugineus TaxID=354439 RepID=A0A834HYC9_RHYFE|nr:hypothetical protein GWI33_019428 [Rhynchophorus ferrugineus]